VTTDASLYDLLSGDREPMRLVMASLCRRMLADELLGPYFVTVDMGKQAVMLAEFLALAFGGPHAYTGRRPQDCARSASWVDRRSFRPGRQSPRQQLARVRCR
jgi:truncated hemoglobin YjbI